MKNIAPAIIVYPFNLAQQAGYAKNEGNSTESPDKNSRLLPRLVEISAGKVVDEGREKNAGPEDYIAIDSQLSRIVVPYHGQKDTNVPHSTDEKKTTKKIVILLPSP